MATQSKRKPVKRKEPAASTATTKAKKLKKLKLPELPGLKQPKLKQLTQVPKGKTPKKPGKPPGHRRRHGPRAEPGVGGALADPQIIAPLANAIVPAGANLQVDVNTNRGDLGYVLEVLDVTLGIAPPPAVQFFVAPPIVNNFSVIVPGGLLTAGHTYRLRVFVNPANGLTPPHLDNVINITAQALGPIGPPGPGPLPPS